MLWMSRYVWVRKGLESPKGAQCQEDASVSRGRLASLSCPILPRDCQLRTQTSRKDLSSPFLAVSGVSP